MSSLMLDKVEESKIKCAERLFEQISGGNVFYHKVDSYKELMGLMK